MKKTLLLGGMLMLLAGFGASAQSLGEGKLMFPTSTLVTNKPDNVVLMWDVDIEQVGTLTINVTGTNSSSGTVTASVVDNSGGNDDNDNVNGYTHSTLEFSVSAYAPTNGDVVITVPEGIVCEKGNSGNTNAQQTITLQWYNSWDEFTTEPMLGGFSEDAPSYNPSELSAVKFTWDNTTGLQRNSSITGAQVISITAKSYDPELGETDSGSQEGVYNIDDKAQIINDALVFDLSEIPVGTYKIWIPTGYVVMTRNSNNAKVVNDPVIYNNWFSVFEGMSTGTPLAPFTSSDPYEFPEVESSVEYVDIEWEGMNLTFTEPKLEVKMYPDDWKENPSVTIPSENITIESSNGTNSILRIKYAGIELNEFFGALRAIDIPEGLVQNESGSQNPQQNVIFNVIAPVLQSEAIFTPANGSYIKADELISLTWEGVTYLDYYSGITLTGNGNSIPLEVYNSWQNPNGQVVLSEGYDALSFDFSKLNLTPGNYTINIPEGVITPFTTTAGSFISPALSYNFGIYDTLADPTIVTPAEGVVASVPTSVTFQWDATDLALNAGTATLTVNSDSPVNLTASVENDILTVTLPQEYTAPGFYKINLPAEFVAGTNSSSVKSLSGEYEVMFEIASPLGDPTVDPAEGDVDSLSEITLTWTGANLSYEEGSVSVTLNGEVLEQNLTPTVSGETMTITLSKEFDLGGEYVVTIPEAIVGGTLAGNTVYNEAIDLTYNIAPQSLPSDFTADPAEGGVDSLKEITLTWTGYTIESVEESAVSVSVDGAAAQVGASLSFEDSTVTITLDSELTEGGEYTVTVNADAISAKSNANGLFTNDEITLEYVISSLDYTLVPADGSNLETLSSETIELTLIPQGPKYDDIAAVTVAVVNADNNANVVFSGDLASTSTNVWSVTVPQNDNLYMLFDGVTYNVNFTVYNSDEEELSTLTAVWNGAGTAPTLPEPTYTPAAGELDEVPAIVVTWKGWTVSNISKDENVTVMVNGETVENEVTAKIEEKLNEDGVNVTSLVLTLDEIDEDETYELTIGIPAGFVVLVNGDFNVPNTSFAISYTINVEPADDGNEDDGDVSDGIASVEADANGYFRVYTLTGAHILSTKDKASLRNLAKGIFIINGNKVIVK